MSLEKRLKFWIEELDAYAGLKPPLFTTRLLRDPSLDEAVKIVGKKEKVDWPSLRRQLEDMRSAYRKFSGFRLIIGLMILVIVTGFISTLIIFIGFSQPETEISIIGGIPLFLFVIFLVFGDWLVYRKNMYAAVKSFRSTALGARRIAQILINRLLDIAKIPPRLKLYYSKYENVVLVSTRLAFNPIMTKKYLLELRIPK
ncbi:MAG: hypothetical protein WED07_10170 [Candidatus Freyarchaeum deiterrae]